MKAYRLETGRQGNMSDCCYIQDNSREGAPTETEVKRDITSRLLLQSKNLDDV